MQYLDIYRLGSNIDIKITHGAHDSEKVVAYLYTKGKQFAEERLKLKTKNVSMTKKDRLRMAGIRVIEDTREFNACCYAKTLFEKIEAERKHGKKVYAKEIAEQLDKELKRRPVPYFINKDAEAEDRAIAEHAILGAKVFSRLHEDEKTELLLDVIDKEHERIY